MPRASPELPVSADASTVVSSMPAPSIVTFLLIITWAPPTLTLPASTRMVNVAPALAFAASTADLMSSNVPIRLFVLSNSCTASLMSRVVPLNCSSSMPDSVSAPSLTVPKPLVSVTPLNEVMKPLASAVTARV